MSLVINTNIASLNGQRNLAATQAQQAQTFQRLSTGLRVNSAKDDAAGLYLAQSQTKDIRGLGMATRNAGDGISMAQTAEGALDQIGKNLQRINELAVQSANGTYSAEARGGLQKEVDQLTQEVNRIVETTEFNGQKLLSTDAKSETLQIGFKNEASSRITTGLDGGIEGVMKRAGETFRVVGSELDLSGLTVNAQGVSTDAAAVAEANNVLAKQYGADFDGTDFTLSANTVSALNTEITNIKGAAANYGEAVGAQFTTLADGNYDDVRTVEANGATFKLSTDVTIATNAVTASTTTVEVYGGKDDDGADIWTDATIADINTVTIADTVDNTIARTEAKVYNTNALGNILAGELTSTNTIDIRTQESAQNAITQTRTAIDMVSELRAEFGANQNRFEAVISGNQTYSENLSAARSRIQDADFAVETANLAKQQVLQQAGVAALGQANASSQVVLGLL